MASVAGSVVGQKLRVNVVALLGERTASKFLVCIDEDAAVEDLVSKVRGQLAKANVDGHLLRLTNAKQAFLLGEDRVGDALRDAEEIIAVLAAEPEPSIVDGMNLVHGPELSCVFTAESPQPLPGPAEVFEEDLQEAASKGFPLEPADLQPRNEWTVDGLTPHLREYITSRFREAHLSSNDANQPSISVIMKPHARIGVASAAKPLYYSIAKIDVIEYDKLCKSKVEGARLSLDNFKRCREALVGLRESGSALNDYAESMLPYRYCVDQDFEARLNEVDDGTFGQVEGFRPMIVIDSSGLAGQSLAYLRAALKRMLYSFFVGKSKFNLVRFSSQGSATIWANSMVPPTVQILRQAEEWLDDLKPSRGTPNVLDAVQLALVSPEVDTVYLLSSGLPRRCNIEYILKGIRSMNIRDVPIHVIGVECDDKAQLDLRRLAEGNHGSFRNKSFTTAINTQQISASLPRDFFSGRERVTIGGQLSILEVMVEEHERHLTDWLEEQKCATRLLLSTSHQPVPDYDEAKSMRQRLAFGENAHQLGRGRPRLQELLEAQPRRVARPTSAHGMSQRSGHDLRRPSVVNPWDRPGGIVRPSHLAKSLTESGRVAARSLSHGPRRSAR